MEKNWKIYPNVKIEADFIPGDFVIIGEPFSNPEQDDIETIFGRNPIIRSHTVIYAGNIIGDYFQTGHGVLVRELNRIGDNVSIGSHTNIEHHITIGNNVRIHSNVFVPEFSVLEDDCWIGPGVILTNARYPRSANVKKELAGPVIRSGAKIGAGVVVLPGVIVGRNALIGAGAVVVEDVPDNSVVVGNPARVIKDITDIPSYS